MLILIFFCWAQSAAALELQFPVSCQLNENCWIISSDEKGTDIVIKSLLDIEKGVPVLAAQDGTVILVKNDIKNKTFYGNSVVIQHTNGWKTIYSHLKPNSINLKKGDFARKGSQIAELGMSGKTDFPLLHFVVFKGDKFFPPSWDSLIKDDLKVSDIVIANIGISTTNPDIKSIKKGDYEGLELLNDSPSLYMWAYGFKFKTGDFLKFSLKNPDNEKILDKVVKVNGDFKETFFSVEKPKEAENWKTGTYTAKLEFIRTGANIANNYVFSFNIKEPEKPVDKEALKKEEEEKEIKRVNTQKRKQYFLYKRLYDQGKLPDTVPQNVKDTLKRLPSTLPEEE